MTNSPPSIVILAGPNGAGKTTVGSRLIAEKFRLSHFVNADDIARGLNVFAPEEAAADAARVMLTRLKELARRRVDFGFETTLATRSFAPWLRELVSRGYRIHLFFVTLAAPEISIFRVAERVRAGGHHVPEEVVRRRFERGIRNFFELYSPIARSWEVYDNTAQGLPESIAFKPEDGEHVIISQEKWNRFQSYVDEQR